MPVVTGHCVQWLEAVNVNSWAFRALSTHIWQSPGDWHNYIFTDEHILHRSLLFWNKMMTIITLDKFEHEGGQHDLISSRKTRQFDKIPPWASPDAKAITRKEERIWVSVLCICYCGVQIKSPLHHFTRNNTLGSQLIGPCGVVFGHKALPRNHAYSYLILPTLLSFASYSFYNSSSLPDCTETWYTI